MASSDLMFTPAGDLASRVRGGELSSRELVQASLDRIDALDGDLNAFVEVDDERALAAADAVQPGDMRPFGILPTTEPRHTGVTRNPWDRDRTPGGSSGGSAAAVAAGMVPLAHGNDGGGSIRIPAACCGLVGLKPARGRISRGPDLGDSFLGAEGVLTRSVVETALLMDVLSGYEPGDATWAPRPSEPYTLAMRRDPGRLKIAVTLDNALGVDCDPEVVRGLHDASATLRELGHEVEEASPALPGADSL